MSGFFNRRPPTQATPRDLGGLRQQSIGASGDALTQLLGLINQKPGEGVLGPLSNVFNTRLNDQISQLNASSPGRFSTANLFQQGQLRQRSMDDFNLLGSQILERGQDRQLQAIMGLLGPTLGPTFGGPFTQNPSGFEHLLGGISSIAELIGAIRGGGGGK